VKRLTSGTTTPQLKISRKEPSSYLASSRKRYYQESEYKLVYPTTPLIESIVLDIPVGLYYKYLNKTIKDSSFFPTTESGLVIKKKYLKVYLEERLA
jgi:hypothetical protein